MVPSISKSRHLFQNTYKSSHSRRKYSCSTQSSSSTSLERTSTSSCSKMNQVSFASDVDEYVETEEDEYEETEEEKEEEDDIFENCCFGTCCIKQNSPTIRKESSVAPLTDSEYDYIERAHKESRLLELYADHSWRFECPSKTSFCLAVIDIPNGLNGLEGFSRWKLPSPTLKTRKIASGRELSHELDNCSISSAEDVTISACSPRERSGMNPPPVPEEIVSIKGEYQVSEMDVLSEKIWHYHNKVSQSDEMLSRKLHLRDRLYTAISPVFPMCGLYVVGSSLNGFGNNASDMDLCLMITNKELDQKNDAVVVLNLILTTLQYEKFVTHQKLILAKVPILRIKFADPYGDITVDLNANNSVAIKNTHLLCYYSSYDWRVRPLVSAVKEWAKRKGINDANRSSFTSYSLVLMVIHYLQCGTSPTVLPNLQKLYPDRFSNKCDVRQLNVTMPLKNPTGPHESYGNDNATLGELLIGFLDYYANKFDYDRDAISIRQGQKLERAAVTRLKVNNHDNTPPSTSASCSSLTVVPNMPMMNHSVPQFPGWRSQWRCVCIEEPFTNSNTAHSIYDEMVFGAIKEAFREAHAELSQNHDLDRLMECVAISIATLHQGATTVSACYTGERPPVSPLPISIPPQHLLNNLPMRPFLQNSNSPAKNSFKNGMNHGNNRGQGHPQRNGGRQWPQNGKVSNSNENQHQNQRGYNRAISNSNSNVKDMADHFDNESIKSSPGKENQKVVPEDVMKKSD